MRSLLSKPSRVVALLQLFFLAFTTSDLMGREPFTAHALTEPPNWIARIDNDWPTGCSPAPFAVATVMPDGKGNVYGSFQSCFKIFKQDLSVPGVWTHVAGDGTDTTLANKMSTQAIGTNTPVTNGGPWMGLNNDIIYYCGQGGTNWAYTFSMELTSGNYGVTVMAGNGVASGCTDGNVPSLGALPTSVLNSPSFGVYRVTDGYIYQAIQACNTVMKLETSFPYQTELEWAGDMSSGSTVNVFGTNDPALIGGGATKTVLRFPGSVLLNSQETEMFVPSVAAIVKIVIATRTSTLVVGGNGGSTALAHSDGFGAGAGFGMGVNAHWVTEDETLFISSFDSNTMTGALVAVDVTTQELRVLPHRFAPPAVTSFVEGPVVGPGGGGVSLPLALKDPLSPPSENRFFVFAQFSGIKGTLTLPTVTMTMSETEEAPTPAPPVPVTPVPATPVPPSPIPPTPSPPSSAGTPAPPTTTTTTTASPSVVATTTSSTTMATTTTTTTATTSVVATSTTTPEVVFDNEPVQGAPPGAAFQNADGGLNSGEKAGISVGVVLVFVAVLGIAGFAFWKFKLSKKKGGDLDAQQIDCGAEAEGEAPRKYLSVSPQEKSMFA